MVHSLASPEDAAEAHERGRGGFILWNASKKVCEWNQSALKNPRRVKRNDSGERFICSEKLVKDFASSVLPRSLGAQITRTMRRKIRTTVIDPDNPTAARTTMFADVERSKTVSRCTRNDFTKDNKTIKMTF